MTAAILHIFPDTDALADAAAVAVVAAAHQAVAAHGSFWLALSGGGTPEPLYRRLGEAPWATQMPWVNTHIVWADERCVPPTDPGSNFGQVHRLLGHLVPADNLHRVEGELEPEAAAAAYRALLKQWAPAGRDWPQLDLALLGLGGDGHTASLFPEQWQSEHATLPAVAVTAHYQDRPANRVTLTPLVFNDALQVAFIVAGAGKAAAVAQVISGESNVRQYPAQRIAPASDRLHWYLDQAAANDVVSR